MTPKTLARIKASQYALPTISLQAYCATVLWSYMCMISAAADEQLKSQGLLAAGVGRPLISTEDQQKRANAIEEIDSEGFLQSAFRSTRSEVCMQLLEEGSSL